jgi:DNA adenine methylase
MTAKIHNPRPLTAADPNSLTPPLKWAGGKRWLLPPLEPLWHRYGKRHRLVEPFCGGLAVALGLRPQRALLNDINPHVINFYHWLQKGLRCSLPMANDSELFYDHRDEFNRLVVEGKSQTRKSAELFYFMNRTCFNGLCRFNKKGLFNVPFGRYKTINYRQDFTAFCEVLKDWEFSSADFERLTVRHDDFIYADPPYDVEFHHYAAGGFGWDDQVRLAHWLALQPGPVALSNQATDRIVELYSDLGFSLTYLNGPRNISRTGDRTPAREILAVAGMD